MRQQLRSTSHSATCRAVYHMSGQVESHEGTDLFFACI
jgi:hypothetical protein